MESQKPMNQHQSSVDNTVDRRVHRNANYSTQQWSIRRCARDQRVRPEDNCSMFIANIDADI